MRNRRPGRVGGHVLDNEGVGGGGGAVQAVDEGVVEGVGELLELGQDSVQ